jgi:hypothetical protein
MLQRMQELQGDKKLAQDRAFTPARIPLSWVDGYEATKCHDGSMVRLECE